MENGTGWRFAAIFSVALLLAAPLAARADAPAAPAADPGVARLSVVTGSVNIVRGDTSGEVAGIVNAPVLGADYVTTGPASRAEIQLDGTSIVRLGADAQLRFTQLGADRRMQVAQGTIELSLLRSSQMRPQIDTPSVTVRPDEPGDYRVAIDDSGRTLVTVRRGSADVTTPQGSRVAMPGTTILASGAAANPSVSTIAAVDFDDFDRFNADRDRLITKALASADVNPYLEGYSDLADYGRWLDVPSYGRVWSPPVAAGWAPYHDGRWVWEDRFGWTWVGYEPWGWAPYHYGRWFYARDNGWLWYPPASLYASRPFWSPALVGFFTFGGGGFGFGFGDLAWVPLGPFESYRPWYGYGSRYTNVTNNTYVTNNITNVYQNASNPNGITAVNLRYLERGNFTHPQHVAPAQLRNVNVVRGTVPVVPTTANLRFTNQDVAHPAPVAAAFRERGFAANAPVVTRVPFERQRQALQVVIHPAAGLQPAASPPSGAVAPSVKRTAPALSSPPSVRFVERATTNAATANGMTPNGVRANGAAVPSTSWDRFGRSRATLPAPSISAPAASSHDPLRSAVARPVPARAPSGPASTPRSLQNASEPVTRAVVGAPPSASRPPPAAVPSRQVQRERTAPRENGDQRSTSEGSRAPR